MDIWHRKQFPTSGGNSDDIFFYVQAIKKKFEFFFLKIQRALNLFHHLKQQQVRDICSWAIGEKKLTEFLFCTNNQSKMMMKKNSVVCVAPFSRISRISNILRLQVYTLYKLYDFNGHSGISSTTLSVSGIIEEKTTFFYPLHRHNRWKKTFKPLWNVCPFSFFFFVSLQS